MSPRLPAVLVLVLGLGPVRADHPAHGPTDPHGEHATALALLPADRATHRAKVNGDWGDPKKWGPLRELPGKTLYVQPGHYLCLGDNSPESSDSRIWGAVPRSIPTPGETWIGMPS